MDGLKQSQRKILYYSMKNKKKQRVSTFAGGVVKDLSYHHGESSLQGAIINMAQDFPVTNNCPLIHSLGTFGDRYDPGAVGQARYSSVEYSQWVEILFN